MSIKAASYGWVHEWLEATQFPMIFRHRPRLQAFVTRGGQVQYNTERVTSIYCVLHIPQLIRKRFAQDDSLKRESTAPSSSLVTSTVEYPHSRCLRVVGDITTPYGAIDKYQQPNIV